MNRVPIGRKAVLAAGALAVTGLLVAGATAANAGTTTPSPQPPALSKLVDPVDGVCVVEVPGAVPALSDVTPGTLSPAEPEQPVITEENGVCVDEDPGTGGAVLLTEDGAATPARD